VPGNVSAYRQAASSCLSYISGAHIAVVVALIDAAPMAGASMYLIIVRRLIATTEGV